MNELIAREKELKELEEILHSNQSEFLAIYGRRRIGKTFLISNFFKNKGLYFELTGIKDASLRVQLKNFAIAFSDLFSRGKLISIPASWLDAFTLLRAQIEERKEKGRIILFFDELPWLASSRSNFLQAFEHFWNRYMSRDKRIILVICGSAAAWMIRNVLDARGGLHGRVTRTIRLLPFNLAETERFLKWRGIDLDRKQIVELYMSMGGVAQYLAQVRRGHSSRQAIQEICFSESGYLAKEFYRLYASLFDHHGHHIAFIKILASHGSGLNREEILKRLELKSGGTASRILNELEESGFILAISSFTKGKGAVTYRLIDQFSLFYLKWMEKFDQKVSLVEDTYWIKQQASQSWAAWAGYAFETICLIHIAQIKKALGLSGISSSQSEWRYKGVHGNFKEKGAQIDLIIDRADHCINLCEIKFHKTEWVLNKKDAENLEKRKEVFQAQTKTKKTLFNTLITSYGAQKNSQYIRVVDQQLTMNDLFVD